MNLVIPDESVFCIATQGYTISENRNYLVYQALKNECTHLLFIDDDMVFPKDTLLRLLWQKKPIIGVVAPQKSFVNETTVVLEDGTVLTKENIPKTLFKCQHVGTGIELIDVEVFKKLKQPWFDTITHPTGMTKVGEDAYFSQKACEAGYEIWCDPGIRIGHLGIFNFSI
jgi:choline kinase